jgi:methionyl-tRNA synthetase
MAEKILVTSALPYANGPIHIGHAVEYVQTDIYVRFLRSCGKDVVYFCADDTHGTPIELSAAKQGLKPEQFVAGIYELHKRDFEELGVSVDWFHSTNSPENRHYAELIYGRLKEKGDIERREIEQTFCEKDKRFLPDRFIRGTCPNCKAADQYGDACEKCGKAYSPTDLIEPKCALCGTPPIRKHSTHLFFKLSRHEEFLQKLLRRPGFIHSGLATQLQGFFEKGLADWDISRDGPYFGFAIPGETDKYFYVWLDAPIGYIATTEKWAKETGKAKSALDYWSPDSPSRIVHFIGKDIVYFHALFWPAVLNVAGLHGPDELKVHGHLTVNGEKMSKSRGTLVSVRTYLDNLDPSYLRYFYAASLGPGPEDFDLSLKDFRLRVNGELVNNVGNLANRSLSMLAGPLEKRLAPGGEGQGKALVEAALARVPEVREAFEKLEYRNAIKAIVEISQAANGFLQTQAPWAKMKTDPEAARADLSDAADVVYLLGALLTPVIPKVTEKLFAQLGAPPLTFEGLEKARYPLLDRSRPIGTPEPLLPRLEEDKVNALIPPAPEGQPTKEAPKKAEKKGEKAEKKPAEAPTTQASPGAGAGGAPGEIEYDDFAKVSLKAGKIVAAEKVAGADKLLKLTVDLGEAAPRTIVSGIALAYTPEQVTGRRVVVVTNLKPRKLKGIESRGMLLTAETGTETGLSLLDPGDVPPGSVVK